MKISDIITNGEVLTRLFNGNVVTLTWGELRAILNHFGNTTKDQFHLIASDYETVTVKFCAANSFVNGPTHRVNTADKYGNETSSPCWGRDMAEAIAADYRAKFPNDTTEIVEQENLEEFRAYWDKENANTSNA